MSLIGLTLIIGGMLGAVKGGFNAIASNIQYDEKLKALNQKRSDLLADYNQSVAHANASANESITNLNANIMNTRFGRDMSLGTSARSIADQQTIAGMQIAELQVQAREAQGSAIQSVATSGVRRMTDSEGNVMNAPVFRTDRANERSLALERAKNSLSLGQSINQARASYIDSTMNIDAYKRQIQFTQNELARTLEKYELSFTQQNRDLTRDIDYMNGTGRRLQNWANFFGVATNIFSGFSSGISLANGINNLQSSTSTET